jgi:hypothetical protein
MPGDRFPAVVAVALALPAALVVCNRGVPEVSQALSDGKRRQSAALVNINTTIGRG